MTEPRNPPSETGTDGFEGDPFFELGLAAADHSGGTRCRIEHHSKEPLRLPFTCPTSTALLGGLDQ